MGPLTWCAKSQMGMSGSTNLFWPSTGLAACFRAPSSAFPELLLAFACCFEEAADEVGLTASGPLIVAADIACRAVLRD